MPPISTHIVIHEYVNGECALFLGDRLVVLDNGDPDWKHGFKVNEFLDFIYYTYFILSLAFCNSFHYCNTQINFNITKKTFKFLYFFRLMTVFNNYSHFQVPVSLHSNLMNNLCV